MFDYLPTKKIRILTKGLHLLIFEVHLFPNSKVCVVTDKVMWCNQHVEKICRKIENEYVSKSINVFKKITTRQV